MLVAAVFLGVVLAAVIAVYSVLRIERWRQTPRELRGDWWADFEHQFRAYATRWEQSRGPRQRHNDHGSIGQ